MKPVLLFGETRTRVGPRHAFIAPDGHVASVIPGIEKATPVVILSPEIGARVTQMLVTFQEGGRAMFPAGETEHFAYVLEGSIEGEIGGKNYGLKEGGYLFCPPFQAVTFARPQAGTRLMFFSKRYRSQEGISLPLVVVGNRESVSGVPFLGDEEARLQVLLPEGLSFDLAVNIFNFAPGTHLPFVETHVMEHGFVMLEGMGVYRLEEDWYPITAGDAIWMAPYCRQWFVAMGKKKSSYLYYKDVNRPLFP